MPKVKETTITDIKIGEFYNISPVTLTRWKKSGDIRLIRRYIAFKDFLDYKIFMDNEIKEYESRNIKINLDDEEIPF